MWPNRPAARDPAPDHAPLLGSYTSAAATAVAEPPDTCTPPATSTRPSPSTVAVCWSRAVAIDFAAVHVPLRGAPPPVPTELVPPVPVPPIGEADACPLGWAEGVGWLVATSPGVGVPMTGVGWGAFTDPTGPICSRGAIRGRRKIPAMMAAATSASVSTPRGSSADWRMMPGTLISAPPRGSALASNW